MSQIININVGKAGVKIGEKLIQKIANQHFSHPNQIRGKPHVFFDQTQKGQHTSRSVFLDIDSRTIDQIKTNNLNYQIPTSNLYKGTGLYSDLFSEGKYLEGAEITEKSFESVRKETEKCDTFSGFIVCNSLGGGTGSGMTTAMLNKLREHYCASIVEHHFVIPEIDNHVSPLHIYNAVLAFHYSVQQTDICVMAENKAINRSLLLEEENFRPTLDQINSVHAEHINQITSPYRFAGSVNTNQRKTCTNLILFPRIKFMISSFTTNKQRSGYLEDLMNPSNYSKSDFFGAKSQQYDIYTMQVNCRDNFGYESEIDAKVRLWLSETKLAFTEWIPNSIHMSISEQISAKPAANMLINSRHVITIFQKWAEVFATQFRRKAFVHHYLAGGMDQMEFTQAESNLNDHISEHIPCSWWNDEEELEDYPEEDGAY